MIVQKIKTKYSGDFDRARKYYTIIGSINDIHFSNLELNLLAYMATEGGIDGENKEIFCTRFDSSKFSVNNCISQLRKKGILNKTKIIKQLELNFGQPLILQITLDGSKGEDIKAGQ